MERGSDKHGPRLDDQLGHEVDALVHGAPDEGRTEGHLHEDPFPEGVVDGVHRNDIEPAVPGLDEQALDLRAAVAAHLASASFPSTSEALRQAARDDHAPENVMSFLDGLPGGRTYEVLGEVWHDGGGTSERRD